MAAPESVSPQVLNLQEVGLVIGASLAAALWLAAYMLMFLFHVMPLAAVPEALAEAESGSTRESSA